MKRAIVSNVERKYFGILIAKLPGCVMNAGQSLEE